MIAPSHDPVLTPEQVDACLSPGAFDRGMQYPECEDCERPHPSMRYRKLLDSWLCDDCAAEAFVTRGYFKKPVVRQ